MESRVFDRLNEFRTSHLGVIIFYGYLLSILVAGVLIAKVIRDNHRIAVQTQRALCAQKQGYEQTYQNSKKYLREHPHGTRDFSKDVIVAAILQSKTQLAAFQDVACPN